jgi:hypothetical protein
MGDGFGKFFARIKRQVVRAPADRLERNRADALSSSRLQPEHNANPEQVRLTGEAIKAYLNAYYNPGRWDGRELAELANLNEDRNAMVAIARGLITVQAKNAGYLDVKAAAGQPDVPAAPTLEEKNIWLEAAKKNSSVGACDYVAAELANYVRGDAIDKKQEIPGMRGQHAFAWKIINGQAWIIDGTWRQFAGKFVDRPTNPQTILVGSVDAVKTQFEGYGLTRDAIFLLKFYWRYAERGRQYPDWLTDLRPETDS